MNASFSTRSILFVCMGNICRSPAAEGVMLHALQKANRIAEIRVDSAGMHDYHAGSRADSRMLAAAKKRGYDLQSIARKIKRHDLEQFDLTIAMDQENLAYLQRLHPQPKSLLKLFSEYLDRDRWPIEVPDPYYGGDEGFEFVLDMLEAGIPKIITSLIPQPVEK